MALEPELEHTHRQTLSSQQDFSLPPLLPTAAVMGGRSWLRGDLASINRHAERLPCLNANRERGRLLLEASFGVLNLLSSL